jgi:hypothetical protein
MMTRKDYVATASILNQYRIDAETISITDFDKVVADFADMFQSDNERFDRERFFEACYDDKEPTS